MVVIMNHSEEKQKKQSVIKHPKKHSVSERTKQVEHKLSSEHRAEKEEGVKCRLKLEKKAAKEAAKEAAKKPLKQHEEEQAIAYTKFTDEDNFELSGDVVDQGA